MALPLLWLGAGLAAVYAGSRLTEGSERHRAPVDVYPGESGQRVKPVDGAIVCCGIYAAFEHTGVWLDDSIVELKGNGLIRAISPQRFLHDRSGSKIYVACDTHGQPLVANGTAQRASERLYQYSDYDVIKNNCHRFVWQCVSGRNDPVTYFSELNHALGRQFGQPVSWYEQQI
ncbi:hypothetical protein LJ739_05300 [Aestuariibacter halophilus]|uniref:LRAT domain-containing protein n=1 Tax=Fluctibacter halophilus TaxID=226011 RepID=A0ABS8G523_9ALTE|nr:lecithin retinol acyltransferase family protein [Aestuariibacter halophilus]MCC2615650.1 hypothetical protein [Aestuariibacter halophilus]